MILTLLILFKKPLLPDLDLVSLKVQLEFVKFHLFNIPYVSTLR